MSLMRSVVLGCGSYLPSRVLTNNELAAKIDTSDEWIVQRTGIERRHIAAEGEGTSVLGIKAAQAALAKMFLQLADLKQAHFCPPLPCSAAMRSGAFITQPPSRFPAAWPPRTSRP